MQCYGLTEAVSVTQLNTFLSICKQIILCQLHLTLNAVVHITEY